MEKKCFKCGIIKPLNEYYIHIKMADGRLNKCKDCTKLDVKKTLENNLKDPKWVQKEKYRNREKYHRLNYKDKHKQESEYQKKRLKVYYDKYPEKKMAKNKTSHIKSVKGHLHHWSYNEDHLKDVIDLSVKDHYKAHRFIIYDQERMMYRNLNGVLLDTKEKHGKDTQI
jgi:hypothetical protein